MFEWLNDLEEWHFEIPLFHGPKFEHLCKHADVNDHIFLITWDLNKLSLQNLVTYLLCQAASRTALDHQQLQI